MKQEILVCVCLVWNRTSSCRLTVFLQFLWLCWESYQFKRLSSFGLGGWWLRQDVMLGMKTQALFTHHPNPVTLGCAGGSTGEGANCFCVMENVGPWFMSFIIFPDAVCHRKNKERIKLSQLALFTEPVWKLNRTEDDGSVLTRGQSVLNWHMCRSFVWAWELWIVGVQRQPGGISMKSSLTVKLEF